MEYLKGVRKWVSHCHIKDVTASHSAAERGTYEYRNIRLIEWNQWIAA